ncbi:hypothetical protein GGU11DRAFT_322288 [Lentinula aff. detonsa]|uniref:Uncharacterized protein n=1 Tax=Lentinula aff. detonsa TaxID=2804958 RepID=A0AA38KMR0_9AGAR|nr:hypothetical protein GGU10DRAFT_377740 [Lentinula aff. detonsa]KAJ3794359.1 hypothetical protein GGU11DRAFT_322288 [Lentinula aff. detonsa]
MRSYTETISKFCFVFVVGIVFLVSVAAFPVKGSEVDLTPHSGLLRRDTHWQVIVSYREKDATILAEHPPTLRTEITKGILSKLPAGHTADISFSTPGTPAFDDDDYIEFRIAWTRDCKTFTTEGHIQFVGDKGDRQLMYTVEARVPIHREATIFFDDQKVFVEHSSQRINQVHAEIKKAVTAEFGQFDTIDSIKFNHPGIPAFKDSAIQFHIDWNGKDKTAGKFELVGQRFKIKPKVTFEEEEGEAGPSTASTAAPSINIIEASPQIGSSSGSCGPWGH